MSSQPTETPMLTYVDCLFGSHSAGAGDPVAIADGVHRRGAGKF
jgi:hypothetical protein